MRRNGKRAGLATLLLLVAMLQAALAAEVRLTDVDAQEDGKRVTLRFTFSETVKPDVTYFYTHNYVGLRASGLQFSSAQLKRDVPPPSGEAARAYRFVRFVQDRESGEIRLYLAKPLTPADAQVVPYDGYVEVTLLKPGLPAAATAPEEEPAPAEPAPAGEVVAAPSGGEELPPTLRENGSAIVREPPPAADPGPDEEPVAQPPTEDPPAGPAGAPVSEPAAQPAEPSPAQPTQQPAQPLGGPSYVGFDLSQVPVQQLTFKGIPFREALVELVAGTGYNVIVGDEVDNSEVYLDFKQKQVSLKGALDLVALAFDLEWSVQPDAIVIKAKSD